MTQVEMARRLGRNQASVSRLERAGDPQLSTLRRFVECLGGRLDLWARLQDGRAFGIATGGGDLRRRR